MTLEKADWHYAAGGSRLGPYSTSQIRAFIASGTIGPDTLVWSGGMAGWTRAAATELVVDLREQQRPFGAANGNADPAPSLANDPAPAAVSAVPPLPPGPPPLPQGSVHISAPAGGGGVPPPLPPGPVAGSSWPAYGGIGGAPAAPKPPARRWWIWVVGAIVAIVVSIVTGVSSGFGGLQVGNLRAVNKNINFRLANTSSRSGDVILWVEQGEFRLCESITYVAANSSYDISLRCSTLEPGTLFLQAMWAEANPGVAAIARRINRQ